MNSLPAPATPIPFELQALANAHRYQKWLIDSVMPFLGQRILELGSGIGNMSQHLPLRERLILSDVEDSFVKNLNEKFHPQGPLSVRKLDGISGQGLEQENLDTVVSFNVLEHVPDDVSLLKDLRTLLLNSKAPGPKRIVTLAPAHPWAYTPVDKEFGHFRRYSDSNFRSLLLQAGGGPLSRKNYYSRYMNIPALVGWCINGKLLGKKNIGVENVKAFEFLCPIIRPIDDFLHKTLGLPLGNSLLTVYWVKND